MLTTNARTFVFAGSITQRSSHGALLDMLAGGCGANRGCMGVRSLMKFNPGVNFSVLIEFKPLTTEDEVKMILKDLQKKCGGKVSLGQLYCEPTQRRIRWLVAVRMGN